MVREKSQDTVKYYLMEKVRFAQPALFRRKIYLDLSQGKKIFQYIKTPFIPRNIMPHGRLIHIFANIFRYIIYFQIDIYILI